MSDRDRETHILLAEDERAHARLLQRAFDATRGMFRLTVVPTLREAQLVLQAHTPDLVIADLRLPDGEGLTLLQQAQQAHLPVVIITAQGNEAMAVEAMKAGAMDYVVKSPESFTQMPTIVRRALRDWQHLQEREQMVQALQEREAALELALQQAEAAAKAKSEFLAMMSHEIRTPLHGMLGMMELLQATSLTADQQEMVDTARGSGTSLLAVLNDILDFSKMEAGRLALEIHDFSVDACVREVLALFQPTASRKGLALRVELPPPPLGARGDDNRIRQVLVNYVGNAIKFTTHGAVTLGVSPTERGLRFWVRDTGIGISEDKRAALFQAFSQGDSTMTRLYGGTGLGLAICKRLVDLMGGAVGVESVLGQGSTFWAEIPLQRVEGAPAAPPPPPAPATGPLALRVLVVEDNPINHRVIARQLARLGCVAEVAVNGQEGVERALSWRPDVILMDCQMPVMDGLEATRLLRAEGVSIPIVALTANAMEGDEARCYEAGMTGFLAKPADVARLEAALRRATGSS